MDLRADLYKNYQTSYNMLNTEQQRAVDRIEGPVLIVAGPGTGKTQLLSTRIAKILLETDVTAQNVLALTFTEAGARNMRERLTTLIGSDAYKVGVFTYHGFANEIIQNNREFFINKNLTSLADEIKKTKLINQIKDDLVYNSLIKKVDASALGSVIADFKKALVSPQDLALIAHENTKLDGKINQALARINIDRIKGARGLAKVLPIYEEILQALEKIDTPDLIGGKYTSNLKIMRNALEEALTEATDTNKTTPLTSWKNNYIAKRDLQNNPQSNDVIANKILVELAKFYSDYEQAKLEAGLFDYDDMILELIDALKHNDDMKFTLQEQYQYILLDEYQDTNKSQNEIIKLLTDNPVNNRRPNIMAVGDDDQAIYAFQGAESSNMIDFHNLFDKVLVVSLKQNYRSHQDILDSAKNVAVTISDRLTTSLPVEIEKDIIAANLNVGASYIARKDFLSQVAEFEWVANEIQSVVESGVAPEEIAVLAPRHKTLQDFVPFLKPKNIAISYEKKENIIEDKIVQALVKIAKLLIAINDKSVENMNQLFPEVLAFDFWQIPATDIWHLSWSANQNRDYWISTMASSDNQALRAAGEFLAALSTKLADRSFEEVLDVLLGAQTINDLKSPLRNFMEKNEEAYYDTLSNLTVLRESLREYADENQPYDIRQFINFIEDYESAGVKIINTNPHRTSDNAVQVMTPFQAKGLEFSHVFLLSVNNRLWNNGRGGQSGVILPENLKFTRIKDGGEDTRKRLLFVAATRAKTHLYLTNYQTDFGGKKTTPLSFLEEIKDGDTFKSQILPEKFAEVELIDHSIPSTDSLQLNWHDFYMPRTEQMRDLLKNHLINYQISPTHVNSFVNIDYADGPVGFYENTILRFPSSPSIGSTLGNIVHSALNQIQDRINLGESPSQDQVTQFALEQTSKQPLSDKERDEITQRSQAIIGEVFLNFIDDFTSGNLAEENFKHSGVTLNNAHLTGKIDQIRIDKTAKTITVVDFKTGSIPKDNAGKFNANSSKIHRYTQQLYFYKLLVENSPKFNGYTVDRGILAFIEPDNRVSQSFEHIIEFSQPEMERLKLLIQAIYDRIKRFDFSFDDSQFSKDLSGIRKFEDSLIKEFAKNNNLEKIWVYAPRKGAIEVAFKDLVD